MNKAPKKIQARLDYLRGEIDAERISYGEIAELQRLRQYIDPADMQLLEWAGVPEQKTGAEYLADEMLETRVTLWWRVRETCWILYSAAYVFMRTGWTDKNEIRKCLRTIWL